MRRLWLFNIRRMTRLGIYASAKQKRHYAHRKRASSAMDGIFELSMQSGFRQSLPK